MWFKNARLYRFTQPVNITAEQLEIALAEKPFRGCGNQDAFHIGWEAALGGRSTALTHSQNGYHIVRLRKEERLLPSTVVREAVDEKAEEIERAEGRKVYRKERNAMKEDIIQTLMPRAFTRSRNTFAYIAPQDGWVVVDASSASKAEELTGLLRECLGSLPIRPPATRKNPEHVMSSWVEGVSAPEGGLQTGYDCELKARGEEKASIRGKGMPSCSEEIAAHLAGGMAVSRLELIWEENLRFTLDKELHLRGIKFSDVLSEKLDEIDSDDDAARFDAAFAIMTGEFRRLFEHLLETFGGEAEIA